MPVASDDILTDGLFKVLFEKSPGSILVKADLPVFTIAAVSDAYLQITSVKREKVIGKSFFDVFPEDKDNPDDENTARKVFTRAIDTGDKIDVPVYRYDIRNPRTGKFEEHYWSCSNTPIRGAGNSVEYILNTVVDISGEVKAKEAAIESENRLLLAAEATGLAIWDLAIPPTHFSYSPQLVTLFGHQPGTRISLSSLRNQVHPDDVPNILVRSYQEALEGGQYDYEARIFWPDNSLHWIRMKGVVLYNNKKRPHRMLGTVVDITESKRDDIRKNDFIAMASHELKTPLTSLKAYVQLLETKLSDAGDPFIKTALSKSLNQVNKMTALVHSFLDLSRLEPGKLQLKRSVFDINKMIEECINDSRMITGSHALVFKPGDPQNVNADREKIGQVVSNLISNAIKYSPKGSTVTITSGIADKDCVEVSVADHGIGIKAKDQEKIFQRFFRVDDDDKKHISGFGIGLYLSNEIIQRHKGKLWVKSAPNKGSIFSFSLPLANV
ncbi:MAG: PAS domain-containing protein [Bacteroidetes bacterium]|nr:PAS domain-containing protein [Bacteroidota bacterium]